MMAGYSILLWVSLFLFNLKGALMVVDNCKTPSCNSSDHYVSVSFPFRIPQYQPNSRCGYNSNFTLSCSLDNQTLLSLANTEEPFIIYTIDYSSQRIFVTDPGRCLPRRFLTLDTSASPFSFIPNWYSYNYYNYYNYYNCTSKTVDSYVYLYSYQVQCMSDKKYTVVVLDSSSSYTYILDNNKNCTLIRSKVSAPRDLYIPNSFMLLYLYWTEPKCRQCTYREVCGFKGNTNLTECRPDTAGTSANSHFNISLFLNLFAPALLLLMVVAALVLRSRNATSTEQQQSNHSETALTQIQSTNITTALSDHSRDSSHPVFVLGDGDVLLEPNTSPCAICLCEYKAGDILRTIDECNHYFHSDCVDAWLRINATCPVCRKGA